MRTEKIYTSLPFALFHGFYPGLVFILLMALPQAVSAAIDPSEIDWISRK